MKDKEKIIKFLQKKYGYKTIRRNGYIRPMYPKTLNKRIEKAVNHFLLFYDEDKEELKKEIKRLETKYRDYQKWAFEFIRNNGLEDKYKKECLKELIV